MAGVQTGKPRNSVRKAPPAAGPAPKAATKAAPQPRKVLTRKAKPAVNAQQWQQMVATAAYLRAEARGFVGGSAEQDWLEAEAELMAKFGGTTASS